MLNSLNQGKVIESKLSKQHQHAHHLKSVNWLETNKV
jgi:hypothetical protein